MKLVSLNALPVAIFISYLETAPSLYLYSGSKTDNSKELIAKYPNFDINVLQRERGVKLELINPPEKAFVDGRIIRSLQANLFSVVRDILFVHTQIISAEKLLALSLHDSISMTNIGLTQIA